MIGASDIEIEKSVLGAMLLEEDALYQAMDIIPKSNVFYIRAHELIFNAIRQLFDKKEPVDILTITNFLRKHGDLEECGGPYYITGLTSNCITTRIEYHARLLIQLWMKRKLSELGMNIASQAELPTTDVFELVDKFQSELTNINSYIIGNDYEYDFAASIGETLKSITTPRSNKITGIPTGHPELSAAISGWNKGKYYILCGQPSHYKTSLEVEFSLQASIENYPVCIFSPDQTEEDLKLKLLSNLSGVALHKIINQTFNSEEIRLVYEASYRLSKLPIYINGNTSQSPNYINTIIRERIRKYGVGFAIVDNIHQMNADGGKNLSPETKISNISDGLKEISHKHNIPLLALCHLNRECEQRDDKRPRLSDMRHSGAIEMGADVVLSSYNAWRHYKEVEKDTDYSNMSQKEYEYLVEIGVLKQKLGRVGDRIFTYVNKDTGHFSSTFSEQISTQAEMPF